MAQMQEQCAQNIELHAKTCSIYGCYAQMLVWSKAEKYVTVAKLLLLSSSQNT